MLTTVLTTTGPDNLPYYPILRSAYGQVSHQQQPVNLKLARGLSPRATHENPLIMRRSAVPVPCLGGGAQGNSRPMRSTCRLPLTSHGTGQSGGRDRLLSWRSYSPAL